ncbi:DNA replication protein SLD5 [Rhodotorula paludigena]|uniref:DNA replication protein SLD5 n=1 Tax=Rhodotorula paludigena TaxID=86838 RepID=UPI003171CAC7
MSRAQGAGRGFFDDDDDDAQHDSLQTNDSLVANAAESLAFPRDLTPIPNQQQPYNGYGDDRGSSVDTASRAGGRISSVTGAAAGSSVRGGYGFDSSRGDSPSLDDILGDGHAKDKSRDVQKLLRAWQNELGAPELLVFPRDLVEKIVKNLARRKELVRKAQTTSGQDDSFYVAASVVATENMRAAHVLKMFTRERIWKLEQCAEYYLSQPDVHQRLYPNEIEHAQGYVRLVKAYQDASAMDAMPEQVTRNPPPMPTPDFSKPVFFRARKDCSPVVLPDGEMFAFSAGSQHMCRYSTIRALLEAGDIELI